MKAQGHGRFVFIASSAGVFGQPLEAHYAAAKTGIVGLSNVIALEGAEHGITTNAVLPFGYSRMVAETLGVYDEPDEVGSFIAAIRPELVVPAVVYLASRACELTHHNFSVGAGRFSRVFVGLSDGWMAEPGLDPTAEELAEHLEQVVATDSYTVPGSIFDEVFGLFDRLGL
jgi:hypothetical protein